MIALILASLLSAHGLRKKSLSPSGAFTAFLVGFLMLGGSVYVFGVTLIGFYLIGSRATKYGKDRKARLEDGYHEGGYRSGWQVLSNSVSALVACFLWNAAFAPSTIHAKIANGLGVDVNRHILGINHLNIYSPQGWCPLSGSINDGWSRMLVFGSLGHFACCLGDTLASELGILSKSKPRLITTLKAVQPGTNGAISLMGTIASIAGGAFVGLFAGITLILENAQCREGAGYLLFQTIAWGMFGGLFGSLVDSLLGATVQQTRYSKSKKVVLQDDSKEVDAVNIISGINVLTNNQVNLVSSVFCALTVGWMSVLLLEYGKLLPL